MADGNTLRAEYNNDVNKNTKKRYLFHKIKTSFKGYSS